MFDLGLLTAVHTIVSLISLAVGLVVIAGMTGSHVSKFWTPIFLWTAVFTSASGFLFPFNGVTPAFAVGIIALIVLAVVFAAQVKGWRRAYVVGVVTSAYFLAFVTVAQVFNKVPALQALAPTQSEPPFAISQLVVLVAFVMMGWLALKESGRSAVTA